MANKISILYFLAWIFCKALLVTIAHHSYGCRSETCPCGRSSWSSTGFTWTSITTAATTKVRRGLLRQGRQVRRCLTRVLPLPQIRPRARQYHPPPPPVPGFSAVDVKNPDVQRLLTSLPRYITNLGGNGVQGLLFPFRRSSSASAPPLPPRPKARKGHDSYIIISNY
ncbi:hypothetical protein IFM47457_08323 [Aspergillus lentulus]|uniref:Uncharacterized protein n=1 Tax=Aspergillus lentulus TaxID=293939 RepID=A0ABQ1AV89_ASPLE|nr:hypothetical protein CNMCM7927_007878 [Aspergillus lentulus]GFF67277.1 hypothetical protein IFM62136_06900 [Aspergillus lentulus]GFF88679.1 hypothetical protein IFM60648_08469 [Aspergillus lentulus]GFF89955.1 hypothetical protein IFM47457_08323 [Aspergillus lentulus]